ncbi:hypothetical protein [Fibrella forsythiae]|uniref:Uncharacterized protein n=1 Tax=Fibrella forsythiae TaxID=2817061 RepID=A0ABS3JT06_9BACT|nr:hypothetical protein [Fibrella forsythiae]MBO0953126.1 hypothetical protein [Fibrella forsythiae]
MPSPQTKPSAANRPEAPRDVDTRLILHRLRDLYAQRKLWQSGQPMALYLTPFSSFGPGLAPVEHWIGSSEEDDAHLLSVPLNALIDHYEQVLWLAKIPLPSL